MEKISLNESDLKLLVRKVLNEEVKDSEIGQIFKTAQQIAQKLNVGENKAEVEIRDDNYGKFIQIHYSQKWGSFMKDADDAKILDMVKRNTNLVTREFRVLEKFYDKPIQFMKGAFSSKTKYVKIESVGVLTRLKVTSATERYYEPERDIYLYYSNGQLSKHSNEKKYLEKYGSDKIDLFEVYIDVNINEA